jgi:integrase
MASVDNAITADEMEKMMKACVTPKEKLVLSCTMLFGMREGEIVHMREAWISYQSNKILIPMEQPCSCSYCKEVGKWKPKTRRGARAIPLWHEWGCASVKSYFGLYKDSGIKSRNTVQNIVKRIAERARVQSNVNPHGLRATAGTNFAEMGMSAQGLCEVMGWSDLRTAQHYIRRCGKTAERELKELKNNSLV